MNRMPNEQLIQCFVEAVKLQLDMEFIYLLVDEFHKRSLELPNVYLKTLQFASETATV
jgi:hypothetical protein